MYYYNHPKFLRKKNILVFGINLFKTKYYKLFILVIIMSVYSHKVCAQKFDIKKTQIYGKWILLNHDQDAYKLHDTIIFENNKEFQTSIVPATTNIGKWSFRSNKLKLKSCLHSSDNPFKCRDYKWIWIVMEFDEDQMKIKQIYNTDEIILIYKKLK